MPVGHHATRAGPVPVWGRRVAALLLGPATALIATSVALTLPPLAALDPTAPAAAAPLTAPVAGSAVAGRPVRIMPLGDSITMGIGTATLDSYRRDLYARLTAAGVA